MVHTAFCKTPTSARSFSHLPTKLPKNMDKKDLAISGRFMESEELIYIYKISMENMTGRRELEVSEMGSSVSLQDSSSDESVCKMEALSVISDGCNSDNSMHRLDFIHPIIQDGDMPTIRTSFQEECSPMTSLSRKGFKSHSYQGTGTSSSPSSSTSSASSGAYDGAGGEHRKLAVHDQVNASPPPLAHLNRSPVPQIKLRRARKVLTSRKSLDSGSRWLYPYSPSSDDRDASMMTNHVTRNTRPPKHVEDMPEILGLLENVVYDSGVHEDLSLSSNYSSASSNWTGKDPHH